MPAMPMTHDKPERRKTRTLEVTPWIKTILITAATATILSLPTMLWHAHKSLEAISAGMMSVNRLGASVNRLANEYDTVVRQNVTLQVQVHRLTDAVNDLRHEKGLTPIEQQTIIGAVPTEAVVNPVEPARSPSVLRAGLIPSK